ncbi:MAG TPA: ATP-binding protein [Polyangia bacterium]|jgi:PAS domain S-box-containing protein
MDAHRATTSVEELVRAILRGATKIVGCGSTNLILVNEKTGEIRVRLGTRDVDPIVAEIEAVIGGSFSGIAFSTTAARDSLIYRCYRERSMLETSSLVELIGRALPGLVVAQMTKLVGRRRILCVPALGPNRAYGVLLFEREGAEPYTRQQRELLLQYARRIGEILENDAVGQGQLLVRERGGPPAALESQLLQLTLGDAAPALFLDPDFMVTSCNDAVEPLLGYAPVDLVRRHVGTLFAEPHVMVEVLRHQALDPATPYCAESALVLRKDGSVTAARVEALLLADEQQGVAGYLVMLRPGGDAAAEASDRLVRQERLATMGEMAAQLAHELRNPIVAVGAALDTLIRDPATPAEQRSLLGAITREVVRMDLTLRDYLAARKELSFGEQRVAGLVDEARELLGAAHRLQGKTIVTAVPPDLVVRADAHALRHVLFNLLLNALEASPAGGEVRCRAVAGERHTAVYVEDRGSGLRAPAAECFQPFFTTKKNGTGLGLTVCQDIARAHGGFVELREREGGGCEAIMVLPRLERAAREVGA